jgi:acyl-CoA thioesterase I
MPRLLIFCYILLNTLLVSCGEKAKENQTGSVPQTEITENENKENSGRKTILFFGTSLTAGLGVDLDEAYPALIQQKIDSLQLGYNVINAGLSGETTASGKNRLNWVLNQHVDVFVLELGANDGLRGVPLQETTNNLQTIIDEVKAKNQNVTIIIAGMEMPPNMGAEYTQEFRSIFPKLAEKNDLKLIPFLLEDVGGVAELNQADGIHPTAEGQKVIARNVWEVLGLVLGEGS